MIEAKENYGIDGKVICTLRDLEGNVVWEKEYHNIVTSAAKAGFAQLINAETSPTFTGIVNYGAVGTGTSTPATSDTQLQTEVGRKTVNGRSRAANVTTLEFYFDPTEANGNLKEFGAFIDGTASANTGTLFDRVSIDVVKTSLNSLTISLVITVS